MDLQFLSKFDLQQLLRKDEETINNIQNINKMYEHHLTLNFTINDANTREIKFNILNNISREYEKEDYEEIINIIYNIYGSDYTIPSLNALSTVDGENALTTDFYINSIEHYQIGVYSVIFSNGELDDVVLTENQLLILTDKVE